MPDGAKGPCSILTAEEEASAEQVTKAEEIATATTFKAMYEAKRTVTDIVEIVVSAGSQTTQELGEE